MLGAIVPLSLGQHHLTREKPVFQLATTVQRTVRCERLIISCSVGRCDLLELRVLGQDLFLGTALPGEVFAIGALGTQLALDAWEPGVQVVLTVRWEPPARIAFLEPTRWNRRKYRRAWYVSFERPFFGALALCRHHSELEPMTCAHPDPSTLPMLFCRTCGYFENGVRVADATDENLRATLTRAVGSEVVLHAYTDTHDGETEPGGPDPFAAVDEPSPEIEAAFDGELDEEGFPF